jgi:hypothetical protein
MRTLRSNCAEINPFKVTKPDASEILAPDHASIMLCPVQETQFCLLICRLLQKIAATEIRSRNLKTSYELSLILTQFSCDELSMLSKGATTCVLSPSNRHKIKISLVITIWN